MRLDDLTEEELRELENYDEEHKNESVFKKIANVFKKKKTNNNDEYEDIPPIKESFKGKVANSLKKLKEKKNAKKNLKKRKKNSGNSDIPKIKESLKDKFNRFKAKIQNKMANRKRINRQLIKSLAITVVSGTLKLLSLAAMFVSASMATTIGIIPAILVSALFVGSASIAHCVFESEFENFVELNEIRKNSVNKENNDELEIRDLDEEVEYENSNEQQLTEDMGYEEVSEQELANEEDIQLEEGNQLIETPEIIEQEKILKTKLTREEKIGKIREFGIGHDSKLGIYCIPVPKEEKSLQRFIREEYKKEYPEEKIQTFETDEKKVLVLKNKPAMFKK